MSAPREQLPPASNNGVRSSLVRPGSPQSRPVFAERLQMSPLRGADSVNDRPGPRRQLTERECRTWLSSHREGRLGYVTGRGPRAVVVNYAVTDEQIVLRLPDYSEITQYALGEEVTLQVDGLAPSIGASEIVTVRGRAHRPGRSGDRLDRRSGRVLAGRNPDQRAVRRPDHRAGHRNRISLAGKPSAEGRWYGGPVRDRRETAHIEPLRQRRIGTENPPVTTITTGLIGNPIRPVV